MIGYEAAGGKMNRVRILCMAILPSIVSVACEPLPKPSPSAEPRLDFERATPTHLQLQLSNDSASAVQFRGSRDIRLGVAPWDVSMRCKAADSSEWDIGRFPLIDGRAEIIEVAPGKKATLAVQSDFANRYKNGRCFVKVLVGEGVWLSSSEFEP